MPTVLIIHSPGGSIKAKPTLEFIVQAPAASLRNCVCNKKLSVSSIALSQSSHGIKEYNMRVYVSFRAV